VLVSGTSCGIHIFMIFDWCLVSDDPLLLLKEMKVRRVKWLGEIHWPFIFKECPICWTLCKWENLQAAEEVIWPWLKIRSGHILREYEWFHAAGKAVIARSALPSVRLYMPLLKFICTGFFRRYQKMFTQNSSYWFVRFEGLSRIELLIVRHLLKPPSTLVWETAFPSGKKSSQLGHHLAWIAHCNASS
jgi:hypothetical protein